jgi:hypothetical protein
VRRSGSIRLLEGVGHFLQEDPREELGMTIAAIIRET